MQATEEDLADLNRVLNERGYLVGKWSAGRSPFVGDVNCNGKIAGRQIEGRFAVLCETDIADYIEHRRLLGKPVDEVMERDRFYRVTTD